MPITFYQLLVPCIALLAIVYAWNLVMRRKKSIWEALLWTIFWSVLASIAIWPNVITILTRVTGIQDRENAVFITSFGIVFFLLFYIIMKLEDLTRQHHRFIRVMALKEFTNTLQAFKTADTERTVKAEN